MKYRSTILTVLASAVLVILLHFYGCASKSTQPLNQSKVSPSQSLAQPKANGQQQNTTVKIVNFKYEPANLKINVGETVNFVNKDEEPHTVTATDGAFNSKGLDTDRPWTYTFTQVGNFPYICAIHPYMKGTVVVIPIGEKK